MKNATAAIVKPTLIRWAIDRSDTSETELAKSVGTSDTVVQGWLDGSGRPSFRQARLIAGRARVPFAFLFLDEPPPETLPIPDFRTIASEEISTISVDLRDVLLAALRKQAWLSDYLRETGGAPNEIVGSVAIDTPVAEVAAEIRVKLGLTDISTRPTTAEAFLRDLVEQAAEIGITVLRSGIVGTNTRRTLDVGEFRGFALSDDYAPFVFINSADASTAQVFTLIHELCHLWTGESGISDVLNNSNPFSGSAPETRCNRIAAEVLVPEAQFRASWQSDLPPEDAVREVAARFRVSRFVAAIRARETDLLSEDEFEALYETFTTSWRSQPRGSGGNFYRTTIARNGPKFTQTVLDATSAQRLLIRDAAALLDVRPAHLARLRTELAGRT